MAKDIKEKLKDIFNGGLDLAGAVVQSKTTDIQTMSLNNANAVNYEAQKIALMQESAKAKIAAQERADSQKELVIYAVVFIVVVVIIATVVMNIKRLNVFK